jgi:hypothetical protein
VEGCDNDSDEPLDIITTAGFLISWMSAAQEIHCAEVG